MHDVGFPGMEDVVVVLSLLESSRGSVSSIVSPMSRSRHSYSECVGKYTQIETLILQKLSSVWWVFFFFFFFNIFFGFVYLSGAHDAVLWSEPEDAHGERRRRGLQPIVADELQPLGLHERRDRHADDRDDEADADPLQQRQAALVAGEPAADERHEESVVEGDEEQRRDGAEQLQGGGRDLEVGAHVEVHREALLQEHDRHLLHGHHEHQRRQPHRHHTRQELHFLHVRHRA